MCTVSYLPLDNGFILTSNRDEAPNRSISEVSDKQTALGKVYFPRDPAAGGSWFAYSENGPAASLLNGAYHPYDISLQFPHSRGLVLLESFEYERVEDFVENGTFEGAAPFTLVMVRDSGLYQLIWDSEELNFSVLDDKTTHFWSSVTLYPEPVRQKRKKLFEKWLDKNPSFEQNEIIHFHEYGGEGDPENDLVMNRDEVVKTLSISSVRSTSKESSFKHVNLDEASASFERVVRKNGSFVQES